MAARIESLFLFLFFSILFFLPLPIGSNTQWAWSLFQVAIFSLLGACVLVFNTVFFNRIRTHKGPILLFVVIFVLLLIQQVSLPVEVLNIISPKSADAYIQAGSSYGSITLDKAATLSALLKLASFISVFLLALFLLNTPEKIQTTLLFMVCVGAIQGFYGAYEILSGQDKALFMDYDINPRANGSFVYHNHFANFMLLCLSAGLGYFFNSLSRRRHRSTSSQLKAIVFSLVETKTMVRVLLTIMVIALVMSRSRMGNTAFFSSLMIVSLIYFFFGKNIPKGFKYLVISMLIIDTFIVSAWFGLAKVKERLEGTSFEAESRDEVYRDMLNIIPDFPFLGAGGGSFETVFANYQSEDIKLYYDQGHNDYLQFAIEYGVPVTLMLGTLLIYCAFLCINIIVKRQRRHLVSTAAASLMAILGMLIHMSVDFPLLPSANSSFFMIFIAIGLITHQWHSEKKAG